jgi:hypothetical protein
LSVAFQVMFCTLAEVQVSPPTGAVTATAGGATSRNEAAIV